MNEKEQKVMKAKLQKRKEMEMRKEEQFKKELIINDNIKHIACKQQYKQEQLRQQLLDKEEKIMMMKLQKQAIENDKKKIQCDMAVKQDNVNQQFQRFLNKKHLDYEDVTQMNELFSNNKRFEMLMQKLKEQQCNESSGGVKYSDRGINSYRQYSNRSNSVGDVKCGNRTIDYKLNHSDNVGGGECDGNNVDNGDDGDTKLNEDIKRKVNEYKDKLSNELKLFIDKEEKKQNAITNQINTPSNQNIKPCLEKILHKTISESNHQITLLNENHPLYRTNEHKLLHSSKHTLPTPPHFNTL